MHIEVTPSRRTYNTDRAATRDRNCRVRTNWIVALQVTTFQSNRDRLCEGAETSPLGEKLFAVYVAGNPIKAGMAVEFCRNVGSNRYPCRRTGGSYAVVVVGSRDDGARWGAAVGVICPAHACSCVYAPDGPQIVEQFSAAASVFTGTATAKRVDGNAGFYEFDVREVFSGDVGATTVVSSYGLSASCGRGFEIGTEYIVFASARENPAGSWSVNSCSATTESSNERTRSAAVAVYGLPRTPDPLVGHCRYRWSHCACDGPAWLVDEGSRS